MALIDHLNPYAYAMRLRRVAYERGWRKSYHPGIPVISVGNIVLGGTGKSPLVLRIAEYIEEKHGMRVAIVSRGYKRRSRGFALVRDGKEILVQVGQSGDEAQMFAEALPHAIVIVDEDRVHGAATAKRLGADVIILDDGFQHLRSKRDLNILLVSEASPVIPFGRAREPESAGRAADFRIYRNEVSKNEALSAARKEFAIIRSIAESLLTLDSQQLPFGTLAQKRVLALSSIASPERFQEMLSGLGAEVEPFSLSDHAEYSDSLVTRILDRARRQKADVVVTTAKDIVKSRHFFERVKPPIPVLILQQKLEFLDGRERFYQAIDNIL